MKKVLIVPILLLIVFITLAIFVEFEVPNKLPDGKNYIDSSNLYTKDGWIYSTEPFLAKPGTRYTFSVSRYYVDGAPFEVMIDLLKDAAIVRRVTEHDGTMEFDINTNTFYFTFMTTPDTNYFKLQISDHGDYEEGTEFVDVQLEEGDTFTEYEPYISSMPLIEKIFYILFGVLILGSLGFGIIGFYINKKPKSKTNSKTKRQV